MYLVLSLNISTTLLILLKNTIFIKKKLHQFPQFIPIYLIQDLLDSFSSLFTNDYLDNKFISVQFKFCNELRFRETISE